MKYKVWTSIICLAALMLCILTGCQLAREDAGTDSSEERLIGVFLTTEYLDLFDFESYIKDNNNKFSGGKIKLNDNNKKYEGRLYAELMPKTLTNTETGEKFVTKEYVFPNLDGITYFSARIPADGEQEVFVTSGSDEAISDGRTDLKCGDKGNGITLEGTVYVTPGQGNTYYFNPVYQSADGGVYTMTGSGISTSGDQGEGAAFSQTIDATYTTTENGKSRTDSISVKISISVMNPPEKIVLLQMGADSSLISRAEYTPGEIPKAIVPVNSAEYIIVETQKTDSSDRITISRKVYGKDVKSLETFFCREDGICVKQLVQINWSQQS